MTLRRGRRSRRLPVVPPLDYLSVSASGAWSLRRLRAGYLGAAIRIRRSNDNAETDIYFGDDGSIDVRAVLGFTGTNSAYITTWYDQTGNGRNATQTTAATQPRIVNAGTLDTRNNRPIVVFSGAQNVKYGTANLMVSGTGEWSANAVGYQTTTAGQTVLGGSNGVAGQQLAKFIKVDTGTLTLGYSSTDVATWATGPAITVNAMWIASGTRSTTSATCYTNGTAGTAVSMPATASTAAAWFGIGADRVNNTTYEWLTGGVAESMLFASVLSSTNRQLIERNQGAYYGVTVA